MWVFLWVQLVSSGSFHWTQALPYFFWVDIMSLVHAPTCVLKTFWFAKWWKLPRTKLMKATFHDVRYASKKGIEIRHNCTVQFTTTLLQHFFFFFAFILFFIYIFNDWDLKLLFTTFNLNHSYQLHQVIALDLNSQKKRVE